jgi:hypothetical protein
MVRVMDAQNLRRDKMRVAMLNVWDARSLGEGALQEGKRYLVGQDTIIGLMTGVQSDAWSKRRLASTDRGRDDRDLSAYPTGYEVEDG